MTRKTNICIDGTDEHKNLELLHRHHTVYQGGTPKENLYKLWRDTYLGYYKCKDCGKTSEVDSYGFNWTWE
jgi:hypothetical protein